MIDHISERIASSYDISCDDIIVDSYKEGEFLVNCRRSDVEYKVGVLNTAKLCASCQIYWLCASLSSSYIKPNIVFIKLHQA